MARLSAKTIFLSGPVLLVSLQAGAHGKHRLIWQNSESVIQAFKDVSRCTERIWPGYTWKNHSILAVKDQRRKQVALHVGSGEVTRPRLDEIPGSEGARSIYSFFSSNGVSWISVNDQYHKYRRGQGQLFELGAHEAFHHVAQKDWTRSGGSRGTLIPVRGEPRYYRAKLQFHLKQAFLNPLEQKEHLSKAKFWFDLWKSEFPKEESLVTDGYEGTAEYAGLLSRLLSLHGCAASDEVLMQAAQESVRTQSGFADLTSGPDFGLDLDAEGYNLGGIASMILKWQRPVSGWEKRVERGETPVQILMEGLTPLKQAILPSELAPFLKTAGKKDQKANEDLGETIALLRGEAFTVVNLPYAWKGGSTMFRDFYVDGEWATSYGVIGEDLHFRSPLGEMRSRDRIVQVYSEGGVCKEYGWTFVVPSADVQASGSRITVESKMLSGSVQGRMRTGGGGIPWLCAGED